MKKQSMVLGTGALVASLVFTSGAAMAGSLALPVGSAGQSAALPSLGTTSSSASAALPAMPATASSLPSAVPASAGQATANGTLPGLDGLGDKQVNAIRPIRIPPNVIPPIALPVSTGG